MLEQSKIIDFQKHGAVLLKGVFTDFVETARAAIEGKHEKNPVGANGPIALTMEDRPFFQDYVVWDQFDGYRRLGARFCHARIGRKTNANQKLRAFFHDHISGLRSLEIPVVTPWHQDQPYYLCEGRQKRQFLGSFGSYPSRTHD